MIPVLKSNQIREADAYTIRHEPVNSLFLMERASKAFVQKFLQIYKKKKLVKVFSGTGNNGGDGLAIARLLFEKGYIVDVFILGEPEKGSPDFSENYQRLPVNPKILDKEAEMPVLEPGAVVIDGIFGSGLSRPVEGFYAHVIDHINQSGCSVVSIDIASGLFADQNPGEGSIMIPEATISFQVPKLVFFQPELVRYVGELHIVDIGLDKDFLASVETSFHFLEKKDIQQILPVRKKYAHKGDAGRLRIVAGSKGKMGAAILAAKASLRAGVGLLFVQAPEFGVPIVQQSVTEAMAIPDIGEDFIKEIHAGTEDVIGLGPGLDTKENTKEALKKFLENCKKDQKLVLDADALNILSENKDLLKLLPEDSILTPHPGEFKRLVGAWKDDFQKLEILREFCTNYKINLVLKGAHSAICSKEGKIYFNSTGNPGMATGGAGDVLFGMICGLYSQKISAENALISGVYLHGLAGDLAARQLTEHAVIASDLIDFLPAAMKDILVN